MVDAPARRRSGDARLLREPTLLRAGEGRPRLPARRPGGRRAHTPDAGASLSPAVASWPPPSSYVKSPIRVVTPMLLDLAQDLRKTQRRYGERMKESIPRLEHRSVENVAERRNDGRMTLGQACRGR